MFSEIERSTNEIPLVALRGRSRRLLAHDLRGLKAEPFDSDPQNLVRAIQPSQALLLTELELSLVRWYLFRPLSRLPTMPGVVTTTSTNPARSDRPISARVLSEESAPMTLTVNFEAA